MTTSDYRSVSCDRHSEYELLAMRRQRIRLRAVTADGVEQVLLCRVVDVQTRDGAEFLVLEMPSGARKSVRLDRILAAEALG